ncbi:MAG TPA: hypothetical protein PKD70_15785, partial [Saprospiraceae bacterium]|nr:hypothetical protein [Saprospiraceae bacterium]HMP15340.1 hypothetical protein [Saprospiraceae bacterium]
RWIELNDPGNDHGLAIDNFSFSINTMTVVADRLTFIGVPTTATTGQPFNIQVCATDANNNTQINYATAIMLLQNMGMNAATILPMPTLNPTNGCVTFTIIPGAGENIAFGATSAMLTGMSGNIFVSSACPQLVVPLECEILVDFNDFRGSGFSPNPSTGQFCSTNIEVTGFMPVSGFNFGGTATTDDFARGVTTGGITQGGIYALNRGSGNYALWVQPTADDFTPGTITLRVQNNSGSTLEDLCFAYEMLVRNDGGRSNSFDFAISKDNQNFTTLITYTSPAAADTLGNQSFQMGECLDGINLSPGEFVYLRWRSDDMGGVGARDEFGIDNILVCVKPAIETDAVAVCEAPDSIKAERDQFYIVISEIDSSYGPYTISIEGEEDREFNGFEVFGPFDHSGVGNEVVVVTIRDARGFPVRVEVVEVLCGYPQNEPFCECELNIPRSPNAGAVLAQSAPGSFMAGGTSGNTQRYILTQNGIILAVNGTGLFTALADGDYEVYALNYCDMDEATIEAFLMTGLMIQPLIDGLNNQGNLSEACYSLCEPAFYTIECEPCPEPEIANFGGPTIEDPCTCSNIDGYFDEEIVITALTGEVWQIGANTGFLDPNTLQPYPVGTQFTETAPGSGVYTLVGVHASGVGFSLSAVSPIFYPNITLAIENTCSYPQPQITSFLPDVICFNAEPIILTGEEANGAQGTGQFLINGTAAPVNGNNEPFFDPSAYPAGPQTITFVWDAGDPADPETKIGCVASISALVTVSYEANIIAESANWTIPSCANEPLTVFYSFNLTGCAAENFDPASLTADFNGLNAVFNYQEDAGDGTRFIEYALSITAADAGERAITISYDLGLGGSVSVSPLINIIVPGNNNGPFITVNNTNPTLPACETTGTA